MAIELAALKPLVGALLLPPGGWIVPLAAAWLLRRRRAAAPLAALALVGLWLSMCTGTARWLQDALLQPPPALTSTQRQALAASAGQQPTAIVVLGSGRETLAPEYGRSMLSPVGLQRLVYALWLARQTGLPLAYAGGVGWGEDGTTSEAETAASIAREQPGQPALRWLDTRSRDTRENAENIVPLLRADGVRRIVLVTSASHMPRALRWFKAAAAGGSPKEPMKSMKSMETMETIELVPAPTGYIGDDDAAALAWLPSGRGALAVHTAWHEWVGLWLTPAR